MKNWAFSIFLMMCGCAWFSAISAAPLIRTEVKAFQPLANDLLVRYRKMIVLAEDDVSRSEVERERVTIVGRILFHEMLARQEALLSHLAAVSPDEFLDWLERDPSLRDADKLAFRELLIELDETFVIKVTPTAAAIHARITADRQALDAIQARYAKEIESITARFGKRGMNLRRENWQEYVSFLRALYQYDPILQEYDRDRTLLLGRRGDSPSEEVNGRKFPPKTLLLTFDDGPHKRYSERVLKILKKYEVGAVFFQVGQQLGSVDALGKIQLGPKAAASKRILSAGGVLANHSYTHSVLSQVTAQVLDTEIVNTNALLKQISGAEPILFRPPYGARNEAVLAGLKQRNMKSIMWNIDSKDWADPVPSSIASRVLEEVEREGRGIILLHDIHERTIDALEMILEGLQGQGYRFAAWDGKDFVAPLESTAAKAAGSTSALYRESWAVIVGIDDYEKWPKLRYAVNDAKAIRDVLIKKYDFKPDNVFSLHNAEATRNNILSVLGDTLGNPERVKRDDRVFVFFAGHGATRQLASGRDLGYLVPVDADQKNYHGQAISMTNFRDIAEAIPAKHVFFVMDSCYSGLGLTRAGATTPAYLQELTRRSARQILTAGGADQQVADSGPNGHSVFTWTLLQALDGRADLNNDGYITASELATYTLPLVASLAPQTPAFGNLPGSEGGEFVFEMKPDTEFLSDLSQQLDDQAIRLNSRLDQLRVKIVKKRLRNQQIKKQIAEGNKELVGTVLPVETTEPAQVTAATHNDHGLALYKARKYTEAIEAFQAARRLDPGDAQAANNIGFVYYKLEMYAESAEWLERTIALDPGRAVAYRNLGDTYEKLNRIADAKRAYKKYLTLNPSASSAASVHEKLKQIQ